MQSERFGFTVFLSACLHVIIIAGIGFAFLNESPATPAIEITLAQFRSEQRPEQADFIAQANQVGSGSVEERVAPATPIESAVHADTIQEVQPIPAVEASSQQQDDTRVITATSAEQQISQQSESDVLDNSRRLSEESAPQDIALAIASLQAQLDLQQEAYAKRPRRYTISSASTQRRHDALYLDNWRKRIEFIGNQNYPSEARQNDIFGSLRMMVALRPNGTVAEIRVLQGSGHQVLDLAAVEIVQRAAPFDPFPAELRGEVDILEIIRTWRFMPGNAFSSR
ncbi:transporter TonB [Pseudohongiella nitratireducens]|uniref:Transporter TonB n=1 Tax=Pseudohongiella nitratireducens TaxID=1768907 RepID=A0A917GLB1_9GAMM|nr:energy transducer TonB [Pseudohongiella nitratireducens]GGG50469.1 transporter TonB [Pseudohongiella nitratireducens]|tara:strand:- start:2286 stop:3134 length:849 start_codon:yes stop_codon:yes gene_type:complete